MCTLGVTDARHPGSRSSKTRACASVLQIAGHRARFAAVTSSSSSSTRTFSTWRNPSRRYISAGTHAIFILYTHTHTHTSVITTENCEPLSVITAEESAILFAPSTCMCVCKVPQRVSFSRRPGNILSSVEF